MTIYGHENNNVIKIIKTLQDLILNDNFSCIYYKLLNNKFKEGNKKFVLN